MGRLLPGFLMLAVMGMIAGCTSTDEEQPANAEPVELTGTWRVEDINEGGVIDNTMVTIRFVEFDKIAGSTGCNRYSGSVTTTNEKFVVSKAVTTRKMCAPAIVKQEDRFLTALNDATRYEIESGTWLVIYDGTNKQRLKLTAMTSAPEPQLNKLDKPLAQHTYFDCSNFGEVGIRFVGPETIELSSAEQNARLQRVRAASGAQYAGKNLKFWNKGEKASFSVEQQNYKCTKRPDS